MYFVIYTDLIWRKRLAFTPLPTFHSFLWRVPFIHLIIAYFHFRFFHPQPSLYTTFAILKSTNNILHHNRSFFFWEGGFPQNSPTNMTFKVEEIFGHPVTSTLRLSPRGDAQEMRPLRCGRRAKVCTFLGEACYRSSGTRVAWRSGVDGSRGSVFLWILSQMLAANMHCCIKCM